MIEELYPAKQHQIPSDLNKVWILGPSVNGQQLALLAFVSVQALTAL